MDRRPDSTEIIVTSNQRHIFDLINILHRNGQLMIDTIMSYMETGEILDKLVSREFNLELCESVPELASLIHSVYEKQLVLFEKMEKAFAEGIPPNKRFIAYAEKCLNQHKSQAH